MSRTGILPGLMPTYFVPATSSPTLSQALRTDLILIARFFKRIDKAMLSEIRQDISRSDSKTISVFKDTDDVEIRAYMQRVQDGSPDEQTFERNVQSFLAYQTCLSAWQLISTALLQFQGQTQYPHLVQWDQSKNIASNFLRLDEEVISI
ncbi:MAG: hypothetical protein MMC33_002803 [Icmadophila ericetorum]|nr:hypothetical protein [Icmadophila ericetorum]